MAGRNFGTMSFGYYYDEAKHQGYSVTTENGLYFGNKNLYTENQNIFISGISNNQIENIKWEIKKI